MSRTGRIVVPNLPYHITQRGNYYHNVFYDDSDQLQYLSWINEYSKKYYLSIYAYCLMDNHIHFIGAPQKENSLSKVFSIAHMRYSQYLNKKRKVSGHLWKGRFYSAVLDEPHLMAAVRYVERNPVRAKMVEKAWQWKWSSAAAHIGNRKGIIALANIVNLIDISIEDWKQYLDSEEEQKDIDTIRRHTMLGRPWGTADFIDKISKRLGRRLNFLPRGRPKKQKNK